MDGEGEGERDGDETDEQSEASSVIAVQIFGGRQYFQRGVLLLLIVAVEGVVGSEVEGSSKLLIWNLEL